MGWFAHLSSPLLPTLALAIWLYLVLAHGRFWQSQPELPVASPGGAPDVDIIVPARDEAATIGPVVDSLLRQRYPGRYRLLLVDDDSSDDTAAVARATAVAAGRPLEIIAGRPKPPGWSGKLWAVSQGVAASSAPVLLLTDADVVHDPEHLASLTARLESPPVDLVSEMVRLNCASLAERALVPAFVYFFQMLYPFARVNDPHSRVAAAAGGTVLLRREALERIGGIESIKGALIDDVTLARAVKRNGRLYLGHSGLAASIRPYPGFAAIWAMITRTAFTQLRYSAPLLVLTVAGMGLVWLVPVASALFSHGWSRAAGAAAFGLSIASFLPTLARFRLSSLWALALPVIASFYLLATIGSAWSYWTGRGARWKNRDYGESHS